MKFIKSADIWFVRFGLSTIQAKLVIYLGLEIIFSVEFLLFSR